MLLCFNVVVESTFIHGFIETDHIRKMKTYVSNVIVKNGPIPAFFRFFRLFNMLHGVVRIRTRGGRMEGTNESTELRRPAPPVSNVLLLFLNARFHMDHFSGHTGCQLHKSIPLHLYLG